MPPEFIHIFFDIWEIFICYTAAVKKKARQHERIDENFIVEIEISYFRGSQKKKGRTLARSPSTTTTTDVRETPTKSIELFVGVARGASGSEKGKQEETKWKKGAKGGGIRYAPGFSPRRLGAVFF